MPALPFSIQVVSQPWGWQGDHTPLFRITHGGVLRTNPCGFRSECIGKTPTKAGLLCQAGCASPVWMSVVFGRGGYPAAILEELQ
jgi:hypothetical protein